jgi:isoleucyl-tRNA synthetase
MGRKQDLRKSPAGRQGREKFILHDGRLMPTENIHLGHALNKVLKDIIVRYKTMAGYDSPYVPGWDTHGCRSNSRLSKHWGLTGTPCLS